MKLSLWLLSCLYTYMCYMQLAFLIVSKTRISLLHIGCIATRKLTIIVLYITYIFQFQSILWVKCETYNWWMELLPSTIVIVSRMRQKTIKFTPSIPCYEAMTWSLTGTVTLKQSSWNWQNWEMNWIKSIAMSRLSNQESREMSPVLCQITFTAFYHSSQFDDMQQRSEQSFDALKFDSSLTW